MGSAREAAGTFFAARSARGRPPLPDAAGLWQGAVDGETPGDITAPSPPQPHVSPRVHPGSSS